MAEPAKRRRRPAVACVLCRKRKIKCNRNLPCNNCIRSRTGDCVYESRPVDAPEPAHATLATATLTTGSWKPILPSPRHGQVGTARPSSGSLHASPTSTQSPTDAGHSHEDEATRLRLRIRELEDQLSRVSMEGSSASPLTTVSSSIETSSSQLGGVFHVQCETPMGNEGPVIARSMMHKTRLFGQTHWCVTGVLLIRDIFETIDEQLQERGAGAWAGIARCKVLARFIKARRCPPWPVVRTSPLPEKELADKLVENYLVNTESIYRVLHIPTFREQYAALWTSGAAAAAAPDPVFAVQTKLVLALGAVTHDSTFSLRPRALQWVYEAQTWLAEPKFKSRLDVPTMQASILLLFAQERFGVTADAMWTGVGALVRRAMFMGLHRDPARLPDRTVLACEMHRRLWNTLCELSLQSSLGSGGPVFLSLSDFDTRPPGNFDDAQLLDPAPVPRPPHECTQMTVALALRETFSQRLDALRFLNDVSSGGSYEETLRLDAALRASYKALGRRLQTCRGRGAKPALTGVELRILDIILYRYLTALHVPYFVAAMQEARYAYSRVVTVDCSLKVWASLAGTTAAAPPQATQSPPFEAEDGLRRQVTRGMSFFMVAAMHSALLIVMELRAQLKESDGLGPKMLRPDLVAVLEQSQAWSLEVIAAGHTNIKGYLLLRIIAVHIDGLSRNLSQELQVENLLAAATEVSETCGRLLTDMAEKLAGGGQHDRVMEPAVAPMPTPPGTSGEWAFTGLDDLLASTEAKTEGWPANYGYSMDEFEWTMFDC